MMEDGDGSESDHANDASAPADAMKNLIVTSRPFLETSEGEQRALRLVPLSAVPTSAAHRFRHPYHWQVLKIVALAALGMLCAADINRGPWASLAHLTPMWLLLVLMALVASVNTLRKMLGSNAWTAVVDGEGAWVNIRSTTRPLRDRLHVVYLPFSDMAWVRTTVRTWTWYNLNNDPPSTYAKTIACADVKLHGAVSLDQLEAALAAEQVGEFNAASQHFLRHFEFNSPGTRLLPDVVSIAPGNIVRIEWHAKPSLAEFLRRLPVTKAAAGSAISAVDEWRRSTDAELEAIASRGNVMELALAIRGRELCDLVMASSATDLSLPLGTRAGGEQRLPPMQRRDTRLA